MVDLGAFCIDSTEVTIAQYDVFLAEAKTKPPTQTTWCATNNADFEKRVPSQIAPANHPVLVDWCDARAFCAWSGKRLCGKIGGAAMSYNTPETKDPKASEHAFACTQGGTTVHPYGDVYDKFACNYAQPFPVGLKLKPVASFPGCTGQSAPYDQVYDLVGNGTEWLDACDLALTSPGPYCTLAREECAASTGSAPINGAAIRCCK
jgi:formylglycine-generating enzyme required for sulfatase activity